MKSSEYTTERQVLDMKIRQTEYKLKELNEMRDTLDRRWKIDCELKIMDAPKESYVEDK